MRKRMIWSLLAIAFLLTMMLGVALAHGQAMTSAPAGGASTPASGQACGEITHLVRWGETLRRIAARYGVSLWDIVACNGIRNPDRIYAGQVLRIPGPLPGGGTPTPVTFATPLPALTATPTPLPLLPCPCEEIVIVAPARGVTVTSPVTVSGFASSPFEQTIFAAVLDAGGGQIGLAAGIIVGEYGQRGPFSITVPFTVPVNSQPGRIQVFTESPRDGAIEHLSSVSVALQGLGLDPLLERLERAVNAKDYAALQALMGPLFRFGLYRSEWAFVTSAQAIEQLRQSYLEPGNPYLDFSVNARQLLSGRTTFPPDVIHVVFSPGWGPDRNDDAFLMIGDVAGQARWTGMLYVRHDLIDYR